MFSKPFFKIFFLVVSFGLFHGIVFLPVVLCLIGPKTYTINNEIDCDKVVTIKSKPKSGGKAKGQSKNHVTSNYLIFESPLSPLLQS